jgi:hypothetical protein
MKCPAAASALLLLGASSLPLAAQVPDQLAHTIPAPQTGSETGMRQGEAVEISADYLVIGAPYADASGEDSGAVYVYDATTRILLFTIPNPDPADVDRFGEQLALSGDRLVAAGDEGSAFSTVPVLYVFDLGGPTPTTPLHTLSAVGGFSFGTSFALEGDRLAVGAPENLYYYTGVYSGYELGQVFVYDLAGATPEDPVLTLDGPTNGTRMGACVALDGDLLVAGSESEFAWVFDLAAADPSVPMEELEHPDGLDLRTSAAIRDPYVVLSNENENNSEGAAYVFDLNRLNPAIPLHRLQAPTPQTSADFGGDLAIATTKVVVGEPDGGDSGNVYIFDLLAADPTVPILTMANPGTELYEDFGYALALSGPNLFVGARFESTVGYRDGKGYLYELNGATPTSPVAEFSETGFETLKEFGWALAMDGDYLAVGAPFADAQEINAGTVTLFDLSSATPTLPLFTAQHPDPQAYANFGYAVDLNGRYLVVGAPEQDLPSENDAGTVYVFDTLGANPATPIHTLEPETPDRDLPFGKAVALSDDWIAVATSKAGSFFSSGDGRVTIYDFSNPSVPVATLTETPDQNNAFGASLALDGDLLAVGAVDYEYQHEDWVYVYNLAGADPSTPIHSFPNPNTPIDPLTGFNEGLFGQTVALSGDWLAVGGLNSAHIYNLGAADPEDSMVKIVFLAGTYDGVDIPYLGSYRVAISGHTLVVALEGANRFIRGYDLSNAQPFDTPIDIVPGILALSDSNDLPLAVAGGRVAVGVPTDDLAGVDNGVVHVFDRSPTPEISVSARGEDLADGGSTVRIGLGTLGVATTPVEVTIRNVGGGPLTGLAVTKAGPHASEFLLHTSGLASALNPGESTSFVVAFRAGGTSLREAALRIASNDDDENPFTVNVIAWALSATDDTDGDGLNDLAEWNLAPLGFDWRDPQPALVATLLDNANSADLFTSDQIGALSVNGVIGQNPANGKFLLTIGVRKSTDHATYDPLPMTPADTTINPEGKLEFEFTVPEDTAFFELEAE